MFFVEAAVVVAFIGGFCAWLLLAERVREWRDRKDEARVSAAVEALHGNPIGELLDHFGPPREQFTGSSGRSLYVWQQPPASGLPRVRGVLIVTLTVDHDGKVVESGWQRR